MKPLNYQTKNTIKKALSFYRITLSTTKPKTLNVFLLEKYMGRTNNPLGKFIRSCLLIPQFNGYYNPQTGVSKSYLANLFGYQYLRAIYWGDIPMPSDYQIDTTWTNTPLPDDVVLAREQEETLMALEHADQLHGVDFASAFVYLDKANRLWHPIQNIKSDIRTLLLERHGYCYSYDIRATAPTLLLQLAKQTADFDSPGIDSYVADPNQLRQQLADNSGLPVSAIKPIINSLFAGSRLSTYKSGYIAQLVKSTVGEHKTAGVVASLQSDLDLQLIRSEISKIWQLLDDTMAVRYKHTEVVDPATGEILIKSRRLPKSGKQKWAVYFGLERQILEVVRDYIRRQGQDVFLIHDGFVTQTAIDLPKLMAEIKQTTGFLVEIV